MERGNNISKQTSFSKTRALLVLAFFFFIPQIKANDSLKVLFIGNSITYYNNMPYLFRDIANNKGKKVSVSMYAPGGTGFLNHVFDPNVYSLFRNNVWDVVVLQPGSGESAGATNPVNLTIQYGHTLIDSIKTYSPCANVYLYQIPYGVPSASTYNVYFNVQTTIRDSVLKMADALQVPMAPAGECFRPYYLQNQNILLHGVYNNIHPSLYGSYLVACAFYCSVFQDSSGGCTYYGGIPQDTAIKFHAIADSVVLQHLSAWRINTYNLHAAFSYQYLNNNTFSFSNLSSNFNSLLWDFGDGSTSVQTNPQHTYTTTPPYTVTLKAMSANLCTDSSSINLSMNAANFIQQKSKKNYVFVYPNPAENELYLRYTFNADRYEIISTSGEHLQSGALTASPGQIDLRALASGIYFIRFMNNKEFVTTEMFCKISN